MNPNQIAQEANVFAHLAQVIKVNSVNNAMVSCSVYDASVICGVSPYPVFSLKPIQSPQPPMQMLHSAVLSLN
jgi:hypothetical protein